MGSGIGDFRFVFEGQLKHELLSLVGRSSSQRWRKAGQWNLLALVPRVPGMLHALQYPQVGSSSGPPFLPGMSLSLCDKDMKNSSGSIQMMEMGSQTSPLPPPVGVKVTTSPLIRMFSQQGHGTGQCRCRNDIPLNKISVC